MKFFLPRNLRRLAMALVFGVSSAALGANTGTKVLLIGGGTSHDFGRFFHAADAATLAVPGKVTVDYTEDSATAARALAATDVAIISTNQKGFDTPEFRVALMKFVDAGKGLVLLHPGVWFNWPWPEYHRELVGGGSLGHAAIGEFEVNLRRDHPVVAGLPAIFQVTDELYRFEPDAAGSAIEVLAETSPDPETKKAYPSVWVVKHPKARIVGIALGHDERVHGLPAFQRLLRNAVTWAAGKN